MHKFLRAIGFSDITKKDLEILIEGIKEKPEIMKVTTDSEGNEFGEFSREFAPNIAQVKAKIYDLTHKEDLNEVEAWNMAYKAIRHNGEQAKKEFNKLPEVVQKAIGDYGQLISWALTDVSQLSYIQQSFIKNFNKVKEANKYSYVNQLIGTSERKMIE